MRVVRLRQEPMRRCRCALAAAGWILLLAAAGPLAAAVSTTADAPSPMGVHCSRVIGSQIIFEFNTSSRVNSFWYWA